MIHPYISTLDIETADTKESSIILSIGACYGNVLTDEAYSTFYVKVKPYQRDRTMSPSTMAFWEKLKTSHPESYNELFANDAMLNAEGIVEALEKYNEWLVSVFKDYHPVVFGNGPEFDNVIVNHAMRQFNIEPQWRYGNNQSVRTVNWFERLLLGTDTKYDADLPVKNNHIAVDDAVHEFLVIRHIVHSFKSKLGVCNDNNDKHAAH